MSLPPPPPPIAVKSSDPIVQKYDDNKCYEMRRISKDEAIKQVIQTASIELERLMTSATGTPAEQDEPLGMIIIMTPILEPILQCGPVCGLVSLSQAAQMLKSTVPPDVIFAEAKRLGVTRNGEMFSAEYMQMLIEQCLKSKSRIIDTNIDDTIKELCDNCLRGKPALIPYDADYNHSPSLRKGHASHWALIHGIALPIHVSKFVELTAAGYISGEIVILEPQQLPNFPGISDKIIDIMLSTDLCYVVAHQGKSLRSGIWKYTDLIKSNQNLHEISPKLISNSEDLVLGNIKLGLCSKLLLLE